MISGSFDKSIKIWDINTGICLKTLRGHEDYITCLEKISSTKIVSGSIGNLIKVWDLPTGTCTKTLLCNYNSTSTILKLNMNKIATGSFANSSIKIWDL